MKSLSDSVALVTGAGQGIGHVHARIADQIEDCKLVAVSDTDPAKEKLAQAYHARRRALHRPILSSGSCGISAESREGKQNLAPVAKTVGKPCG